MYSTRSVCPWLEVRQPPSGTTRMRSCAGPCRGQRPAPLRFGSPVQQAGSPPRRGYRAGMPGDSRPLPTRDRRTVPGRRPGADRGAVASLARAAGRTPHTISLVHLLSVPRMWYVGCLLSVVPIQKPVERWWSGWRRAGGDRLHGQKGDSTCRLPIVLSNQTESPRFTRS